MTDLPARRQRAEGLEAVFHPRSVAVVGAGRDPRSPGRRILESIRANGYRGALHAVHPNEAAIAGVPAVPRVGLVEPAPDLAVVAVPADRAVDVVEECGQAGVKAVVLVTAGFREAGPEGRVLEERLRAVVDHDGMRLIGPNCLGILSAGPRTQLHATFAPRPVVPGTTAIMTQSGAMGIALLEHAYRTGVGVSRFVSMGNKMDVSGNDLLLAWEDDPEVELILVYLESLGNPRNFLRIARRVGAKKPIVLLKGGRSEPGAKAAGSHTGALLDKDALVEALVEQTGVLRAATVEQLFGTAAALATGRRMAGPRIAIVTQSGGPAILAADAIEGTGLRLARLSPETAASCRALLPAAASISNPLDTLAGADPALFARIASTVAADPGVDALLALYTPLDLDATTVADALVTVARSTPKPVVAVVFGRGPDDEGVRRLLAEHCPTYAFPEDAVRALGDLDLLRVRRERTAEPVPQVPRLDGKGWLPTAHALELAQAYGLPVVPWRSVRDGEQARGQASALAGPYALKLDVEGVVHKTEAGAVHLGLRSPAEVASAYLDGARRHGAALRGGIVMQMARPGVQVLVGGVQDERYGPAVAVGLGGIHAEVLKDTVFRLAPFTQAEALRMLAALRGAALLDGVRGAPAVDKEALARAMVAFGRLMAEHPEVLEAEMNPLFARPDGVEAVDMRCRVA